MSGRLEGRVVIVTLDPAEIGAASATALQSAGATVAVAPMGASPEVVVADVVAERGALHALHLTVTDEAEQWCRRGAAAIAGSGGGAVVTTVTTRALSGDLHGMDEAVAGGGVVALTYAVATSFGKRAVRANCVAVPPADIPSEVLSASTLVPAPGPDDVAALAVYLMSDEASFVTGQVVRCDGGLLAHLPHYASLVASGATTAGGRT